MTINNVDEPIIIEANSFQDERGSFVKLWQEETSWVRQVNLSHTNSKGTVRGIHGSFSQSEMKLVTCVSGKVMDIAVNLITDSENFGKVYYQELSGANRSFVIPKGYGHAFQALTDDCTLIYHHNVVYEPADQLNVSLQSPLFNVQLPLPIAQASDKDRNSVRIIEMKQLHELVKSHR